MLFFHSHSSLYSPKIMIPPPMRSGVPLLSPKPSSKAMRGLRMSAFLHQSLTPQDKKVGRALGWLPALFSTNSHKMKFTSKVFQRALYERREQCDSAYHIWTPSFLENDQNNSWTSSSCARSSKSAYPKTTSYSPKSNEIPIMRPTLPFCLLQKYTWPMGCCLPAPRLGKNTYNVFFSLKNDIQTLNDLSLPSCALSPSILKTRWLSIMPSSCAKAPNSKIGQKSTMEDLLLFSKKTYKKCQWSESLCFLSKQTAKDKMSSSCPLSGKNVYKTFGCLLPIFEPLKSPKTCSYTPMALRRALALLSDKVSQDHVMRASQPNPTTCRASFEPKMCMPLGRWSIWYLSSPYVSTSTNSKLSQPIK